MSDPRPDFEQLFNESYEAVSRYAARRVAPDAVQDVVADTFLVAWRRRDQLRGEPLPWLLGIARRIASTQRRGNARREALRERLSSEPATVERGPGGPLDGGDDPQLALALSTLGSRDREALLLIAWDGLDHRAAARVMGCSTGSLSTTRGEGCLQIGRLVEGKLGALGQDHAFGDDGRFHELPVSAAFDINGCALLDGRGRLFTNVTADERPASAWIGAGGRLAGCVPPSADSYEKGLHLSRRERELGARPAAICKQADLRNIYYGLLGAQAQSITYVLDGHRHTLDTVGVNGAYMFVTRASAHQLLNFANAGTADIVPVDGPIREIHYRDGSTCHLTAKSWIGGAYACTPSLPEPVGYMPVGKAPSSAEVATPIHVRLTHGFHGRTVAAIHFTARLPIADARRIYSIRWREAGMPPGAYGGESTNGDVAAGQTIAKTIEGDGRSLRAGVVSGTVSLQQALGAGGIEGPGSVSVLVGRFSIRVP